MTFKRVRLIAVCLMFSIICVLSDNTVYASSKNDLTSEEFIEKFDVDITVKRDAVIDVVETITYNFGSEQSGNEHHGIYRTIPISYEARGGNYTTDIDHIFVTNEHGTARSYSISRNDRYLTIKIGDPHKRVYGRHVYRIMYRVHDIINFFDDHDELYWNVTGNDWHVPIKSVSARVHIPGKVMRTQCFVGVSGSTDACSIGMVKKNDAIFSHAGLGEGEGMTVVVSVQKGILKEPSAMTCIWHTITDNLMALSPLFVGSGMFYLWYTRGRDRRRHGTIIPRYSPPANMTPADVSFIVHEGIHPRDVGATLIDLAVRGYITITRSTQDNYESASHDYVIKRTHADEKKLLSHEKILLGKILGGEDQGNVSVLRDDQSFFYTFKKVCTERYAGKYFVKNPEKVKSMYVVAGFMIIFGGTFFSAGNVYNVIGALLSGLCVIAFSHFMPARTREGVNVYEHIMDFKDFLSVTEKDRLAFHNAPEKNPKTFEKFLPYAIALGVEKQWARQFDDLYNRQPEWYKSDGSLSASTLVRDLSHFENAVSVISKSAAGGSSGFSGGSSGGGFGGGGGGSW